MKKLNAHKFQHLISDLVVAGLERNSERVELISLVLSREIAKEDPIFAKEIRSILGNYAIGADFIRTGKKTPIPTDQESHLETAIVIPPNTTIYQEPILPEHIKLIISNFLEEREKADLLIKQNIKPANSLLITGQPGTGKTMLAHYIASYLNKNLVVLDLAASISSLLGKTGQNLRKVLNYAKQSSSVLLLDEFDAIAKRRDDPTDLGELKRVVNVLLMELEKWPNSAVIIANSNHPELLDKAIWRRFDIVLKLPLPEQNERLTILNNNLAEFFENATSKHKEELLYQVAKLLENQSSSEITKYTEKVKKSVVLRNQPLESALIYEAGFIIDDKKIKAKFCKIAKKVLKDEITVRQLAYVTGLSVGGVQYHIGREENKYE